MIKAGIVGISGYSGYETLAILLKHPQARVTYVSAHNTQGAVDELWPQLKGRTSLYCEKYDSQKAIANCDVIFLAVPHTASMEMTPELLKAKKKVIDLSGDYRLKDVQSYQEWYGTEHKDTENLAAAVYGLPEIYREKIRKTHFVSNPGCYPTAAILGVAPILSTHSAAVQSIIIDAKSGVSGAGKKMAASLMSCEVNENFKAYKVLTHQHTPEIDQCLSQLSGGNVQVTFVAHLLPVNRGILETIYIQLKEKMTLAQIRGIYEKFYKNESFVRVLADGQQPELKNVQHTNFCDIGLAYSEQKNLLVVTSAIDNLVKGAAGQAVQNMNLICGFKEEEGLL